MKYSNFWICYTSYAVLLYKNLLPVLKNQNSVYIQDGVENIYIYPIFSKM
jgi:hypothetical protein